MDHMTFQFIDLTLTAVLVLFLGAIPRIEAGTVQLLDNLGEAALALRYSLVAAIISDTNGTIQIVNQQAE